jgi:hypothetical protein
MQVGEFSDWLTQYYHIDMSTMIKSWRPVPWVGRHYPRRLDANWRKPVSFRAKVQAAWAALPKAFRYYVLRKGL